MSKRIYLLLMMFTCLSCVEKSTPKEVVITDGKQAVIAFETRTIDMGTLVAGDTTSNVAVFYFTNTGNNALLLKKVKTSCSCLVSNYSKHPIKPGEKGSIEIRMQTNKQLGTFGKTVYVKSNAKNSYEVLHVKGKIRK